MDKVTLGLIGGLAAGLATILGSLLIFKRSHSRLNLLPGLSLDFAIGMMLAASAFSLIGPAFSSLPHPNGEAYFHVSLALLGGVAFIQVLGRLIGRFQSGSHQKAALFVTAMMLHNLPEGLAAGAALTATDQAQAWSILGAISLQNLPEGFTTALAFSTLGMSLPWAFAGAAMSGVVEILGGLVGGMITASVEAALPYLLAFAGGAMISVTLTEVWARIKEKSFAFLLKKDFVLGSMTVVMLQFFFSGN